MQVRDWLYVEDHAAALEALARGGRPGEKYNVGARSERTNLAVVEAICDALDQLEPSAHGPRRRLITFVEDRPGHDRRYAIDPRKIEMEVCWRPRSSFEEGLGATVRWYLENAEWWRPLRQRYAGARLGAAGGAAR